MGGQQGRQASRCDRAFRGLRLTRQFEDANVRVAAINGIDAATHSLNCRTEGMRPDEAAGAKQQGSRLRTFCGRADRGLRGRRPDNNRSLSGQKRISPRGQRRCESVCDERNANASFRPTSKPSSGQIEIQGDKFNGPSTFFAECGGRVHGSDVQCLVRVIRLDDEQAAHDFL